MKSATDQLYMEKKEEIETISHIIRSVFIKKHKQKISQLEM